MMHNNVSDRNFMNAETAKFTGAVLLVTEIYALLASLVTGLEYIFAMMFMNQFAYYASGKLLDGSKYIHLLTGIVYADGVAKDVVLVSAKLFVLVAVLDILYVFVKTKWLKHAKIKVFSENTVVMAFAVISSAAYSWNMLLESSTLYLQLNKPATLFTGSAPWLSTGDSCSLCSLASGRRCSFSVTRRRLLIPKAKFDWQKC